MTGKISEASRKTSEGPDGPSEWRRLCGFRVVPCKARAAATWWRSRPHRTSASKPEAPRRCARMEQMPSAVSCPRRAAVGPRCDVRVEHPSCVLSATSICERSTASRAIGHERPLSKTDDSLSCRDELSATRDRAAGQHSRVRRRQGSLVEWGRPSGRTQRRA